MAQSLPDCDLLGLGFDILGAYSADSTTRPIVTLPGGPTKTATYSGQTYEVPKGVRTYAGSGNWALAGGATVFESEQEVQHHLAVTAGVKGSYGGFSGGLSVLFGSDSSVKESKWYALVEGTVERFTMQLETLTTLSPIFEQDADVKKMLATAATGFDETQPKDFFRVFERFGTHVVSRATVGARIDYAATVDKTVSNDKTVIETKLDAEYEAVISDTNGSAKVAADWSKAGDTWAKSRRVRIGLTGGDESNMLTTLDPSFADNYHDQFDAWGKTINQSPKMMRFQLTRLSDLFTGQVRDSIGSALDAYTDYGILVKADRASKRNSAFIQVAGKNIATDPNPQGDWGAQLVVLDPATLIPVLNRTVIHPTQGTAKDWDPVFDGINALPSDYICVLAVFGWAIQDFPPAHLAGWLEGSGASLKEWSNHRSPNNTMTYVFIGQNNLKSGLGSEQLDWERSGNASASVTTRLVPQVGGGFKLPTS